MTERQQSRRVDQILSLTLVTSGVTGALILRKGLPSPARDISLVLKQLRRWKEGLLPAMALQSYQTTEEKTKENYSLFTGVILDAVETAVVEEHPVAAEIPRVCRQAKGYGCPPDFLSFLFFFGGGGRRLTMCTFIRLFVAQFNRWAEICRG